MLRRNFSESVFLIIPLGAVLFIGATLHEMTHFYFGWFDPVYAYLMNGLTFARGSLDIGHTDHPGTPLQLFCALIIKLVGLFRGTGDLSTDVISHPELYAAVISYSLILINVVIIYLLGARTYKITGNKMLAVVIQLAPFLSSDAIHFIPIIATESILVFSTILMALLMIVYTMSLNEEQKTPIAGFVLLSGLILATKISALPVLVVPFFFIKGNKRKIIYGVLTLVVAFLLVLPVLSKLQHFFQFIEGIFTHTGKYGSGEKNIIDWSVYLAALRDIITRDIPFTLHLILLLFGWLMLVRNRDLPVHLKRIWLGLTVSTVISIAIVARHYSFHYLLPIYVISLPLQVLFWYKIFEPRFKQVNRKWALWIIGLLIPLVFLRLVILFKFYPKAETPVRKTVAKIEEKYHGPFVIFNPGSRGGAFPEPALHFGLSYTGSGVRKVYKNIIAIKYPGNYLWNDRKGLYNWNGNVLVADLFSKKDSIYLYNHSTSCEDGVLEMKEMIEKNGLKNLTSLQIVYENELSHEVIAVAHNNKKAIRKKLIPDRVIFTGMEQLTDDHKRFVDESGNYTFDGGRLQSDKNALDGNCSIMLTSAHPYGLKVILPVNPGDRFRIDAWQKYKNEKGALIVASANNGRLFYKTSTMTSHQNEGWKKSELIFPVPDNYPDTTINLYLWLPKGDSVWVDNFKIEYFSATE